MFQMNKIKIEDKYVIEEVTSKDMSRKELLSYIFGDFIRGFYFVGAIFLDFIIIPQIFSFIPGRLFGNGLMIRIPMWNYSVSGILLFFMAIIIVFSIFYEVKIYFMIWGRIVKIPSREA